MDLARQFPQAHPLFGHQAAYLLAKGHRLGCCVLPLLARAGWATVNVSTVCIRCHHPGGVSRKLGGMFGAG